MKAKAAREARLAASRPRPIPGRVYELTAHGIIVTAVVRPAR